MRKSLFILLAFISTIGYAQNFEISAAAYGLGNYGNELQPNQEVFDEASYSPMASFSYFHPIFQNRDSTFSLKVGAGLSYTHYKGNWSEPIFYSALTVTGAVEYEEFHRFDGNIHVLGLEVTPVVTTFWNRLELRSGLFLGFNVSDKYTYNLLVNQTVYENGNVTFYDGAFESFPVEGPQIVLHSNSRLSYKIAFLSKYTLSPFYQFSAALLNEGESRYYEKVISYRHHFGLAFGFGGK